MKNRLVIIRCVLVLGLLCGLGHTAAFAYVYAPHAQSESWGYQPVYDFDPSVAAYQFHTTSIYNPSGGIVPINMSPRRNAIMSDNWWEEDPSDDDDPMGTVPDVPLGDGFWILLLMAAGYFAMLVLCKKGVNARRNTFFGRNVCIFEKYVVSLRDFLRV